MNQDTQLISVCNLGHPTCVNISVQCVLPVTDTTRTPKTDDDQISFYFVSEEHMRAEIMAHKFIEFGKHQQHLYGIKVESVLDVVKTRRMCILDVHPQVCEQVVVTYV